MIDNKWHTVQMGNHTSTEAMYVGTGVVLKQESWVANDIMSMVFIPGVRLYPITDSNHVRIGPK